MLEATGIKKSFGATLALEGVSLRIEPGQVHALLGENGSGKSTLMRILSGELAADEGSMSIEAKPYAPTSPHDAQECGVALIHQELAICPHLTIAQNLFLGRERTKGFLLDQKAMRKAAQDVFARLGLERLNVDLPAKLESASVHQLTDIARGILSNARFLLFDEPTTSLGRHDVEALFHVIRRLRDAGNAIVYITHFLDEVSEIADVATVLRDGRVTAHFDVSQTNPRLMAEAMTGRNLDAIYPVRTHDLGEVALTCKAMSGTVAPKNLSFQLRKGEVLGIAGLNGAGRTETLRCLFRLDPHTAQEAPRASWSAGFGFVSEDRKGEGLALRLSIAENLVMPKPGSTKHPRRVSRKEWMRRTSSVTSRLAIKCAGPNQTIQQLSGGNQQKVAFGRLLDQDSDVLLLDEPTKGIDIGAKERIYAEIAHLAEQGKSILLVSSYLPELLGLCDRILVLRRGECVAVVDAKSTNEHELLGWCAGA